MVVYGGVRWCMVVSGGVRWCKVVSGGVRQWCVVVCGGVVVYGGVWWCAVVCSSEFWSEDGGVSSGGPTRVSSVPCIHIPSFAIASRYSSIVLT